jgi:hypothetical protein
MFSIAAIFVGTLPRRMATVSRSPPLLLAEIASSRVTFVTEANNALAKVMEFSVAFAECLEPLRVLVTGPSIGKYAGLLGACPDGARFSKPSAMSWR